MSHADVTHWYGKSLAEVAADMPKAGKSGTGWLSPIAKYKKIVPPAPPTSNVNGVVAGDRIRFLGDVFYVTAITMELDTEIKTLELSKKAPAKPKK